MSDDESPSTQPENQRSGNVLLYIVLAVMTGIAGFFTYKSYQEHQGRLQLVQQVSADSVRIADLDKKYTETLATLSSYKGLNAQLDSIIKVREGELTKCRTEFLTMVRKNEMSDDQYQLQLADLRGINTDFQSQIAQLQAANKLLRISRDSLGRVVLDQNGNIAVLHDSLSVLSNKVLMASLLKPGNISVTSTRTKKNNKDSETKKSAKVDQLKICFDVPQNDVAAADTQIFHIRIMDPKGETLSGTTTKTLTLASTGEDIPYSISSKVQYKNVATKSCAYFRANVTYTSGDYTIEIYQDGFLVGTQKFSLK